MTWIPLLLATAALLPDDCDDCFSAVARAGDVDGDGVGDVLVASRHPRHGPGSRLPAAVWILSGADGQRLRELRPRVPCRRFGSSMAGGFDLDGDGLPEAIVGADDHPLDAQASKRPRRGAALIFAGADGSLLRFLEAPPGAVAFGFSVAAGGDLDGDGRGDLVVGAPAPDCRGRVYCYSGDGRLLRELVPQDGHESERFGNSVAIVPDLDGDGLADLVVGAPSEAYRNYELGAVELRSGADGALIRRIEEAEQIGWLVGTPGDVDTDGTPDVFASSIGRAFRVYSGHDGRTLQAREWFYLDGTSGEGSSADGVGDWDGDGVDDYAVGANETWCLFGEDPGFAIVRSGATGETLYELRAPRDDRHDDGIDVCGLGDVDGDGRPDLAVCLSRSQVVRAISGADGAVVWSHDRRLLLPAGDLPAGPPHRGDVDDRAPAIATVGDLDGDGLADLVVAERAAPPYRSGPPGRVRAVSARDGAILREWRPERPCELHGSAVAPAGDLDGDGVPDVWIGAEDQPFDVAGEGGSWRTRTGLVLARSGADGRRLRRLESPDDARRFGYALAGGADLDGDGVPDLLVGAPARAADADGRVYLYSGADGALLATLTGAEDVKLHGTRTAFGHALAFLPDLDGDGAADFAVGLPMGREPGEPGRVELYSGAARAPLRVIEAPRPIGWAVGVTGDLDGDGLADLWTTSLGDALLVCSSASGETLTTVELRGATEGTHAALAPDLDGDGARDLAIATLDRGVRARVVSSRTGEELATVAGGPAGVDLGAAPDSNGVPRLAVLRRGRYALELVPVPARR